MRQKNLVTICGALIAVSFYLPFLSLPAPAPSFSPFSALREIPAYADLDIKAIMDLPPLLQTFAATFALGLITCLLSLVGWTPRLLVLVTALLPFGVAAYAWFQGRSQVESLGVTLPVGGFGDAFNQLTQIAGFGFWMWAGAATLLLLAALLDPGDRF